MLLLSAVPITINQSGGKLQSEMHTHGVAYLFGIQKHYYLRLGFGIQKHYYLR
jgi:hypothetical protein